MVTNYKKNQETVQLPDKNSGIDYRKELQRGLIDVQTRNNALNSMEIINSNSLKKMKGELLKGLFDEMRKNGVDLNDLQSINSFLAKLERTDPDLKELFSMALDSLLPEEQAEMPVEAMPQGLAQQGMPSQTEIPLQ